MVGTYPVSLDRHLVMHPEVLLMILMRVGVLAGELFTPSHVFGNACEFSIVVLLIYV